jgi:hypothetical protein
MDNHQPAADMGEASSTAVTAAAGKDIKGWTVLVLAVVGALGILVASVGSGWGLWDWTVGLSAIPFLAGAAILALVIAIVGVILDRRKGRSTRWLRLGAGVVIALGLLFQMTGYVRAVSALPAIHDISTDLADAPQFQTLTLRADNWDNIPGADDADMRGMNPQQRWVQLHQRAYPDIRSVRIDQPVAEVVTKARRIAEDRGWTIAAADPASGRLEATDTTALFRFKDDIVLRARPTANGQGSIIDVRSVSRVGIHDLGVNAKRVRSFLSDLSGTTSATGK